MSLQSKIQDGSGNGYLAKVNKYGLLATGPLGFSQAYSVTASVINTAYNFVPPEAGKQFVITSILLYANKNVGANDATVVLYEADGVDSTTVTKEVLTTEMLKQTNRDLTNLNLIVSEGKWLNIKTDDNTIFSTVLGYYVPVS